MSPHMNSIKIIIAIVVLCSAGLLPAQDTKIDPSHYIHNDGSNCAWVSLDMLGRHNKIDNLIGISDIYSGETMLCTITNILDLMGVDHEAVDRCKTDKVIEDMIIKPCRNNEGAIVGVCEPDNGCHMYIVVHYDKANKDIRILDNRELNFEIIHIDWKYFHEIWDGTVINVKNKPN